MAQLLPSTQLLGGDSRFVLSTNGHIAALVNPPTNPKSSYQALPTARTTRRTAGVVDAAKTEQGSWWPDYAAWLADRSGPQRPSPTTPGNARFAALGAAPGSYVLDR